MYHILIMSGKYYGSNVDQLDDDDLIERLKNFTNEGTPCILVGELEDVHELGIDPDDVQIVEIED